MKKEKMHEFSPKVSEMCIGKIYKKNNGLTYRNSRKLIGKTKSCRLTQLLRRVSHPVIRYFIPNIGALKTNFEIVDKNNPVQKHSLYFPRRRMRDL